MAVVVSLIIKKPKEEEEDEEHGLGDDEILQMTRLYGGQVAGHHAMPGQRQSHDRKWKGVVISNTYS